MVFTSVAFLFFFLPAALVYHLLPLKLKFKNIYLLLLSLIFYTYGEGRNVIIMLIAITASHIGAVVIDKYPKYKKAALAVTVGILLSQLIVFKYLGFIQNIISRLVPVTPINIIMPIGISFFTFQAITYTVDVYRGSRPANNILDAGLYISLFPQLVAGPIVRYDTIADELRLRKTSLSDFAEGLDRFLIGFSMKMLLANVFGSIADKAFALNNANELYMQMALVGIVAYTLQIYYDFCAYSHMAIGMGRMFGFHFSENFDHPYISKSITEFWRRWHISLSSFFKDYVYIPLGGNRTSSVRHIINLTVVWFLTGLWHGAGFNYIAWGLYNLVLLMAEKYLFKKKNISVVTTLLLVMAGWILFRSDGLGMALNYFKSFASFTVPQGHTYLYYLIQYKLEWILGFAFISPAIGKFFDRHVTIKRVLLIAVFVIATIRLFVNGFNPFIYFRF